MKEYTYHFEILITVSSPQKNKCLENLINDLQEFDIQEWIQSMEFNIHTPEFDYDCKNYKLKVKNKTIFIRSKKNNNSIRPNIYDYYEIFKNRLDVSKMVTGNDRQIAQMLNQITNEYNGKDTQTSTSAKYKTVIQKINNINLNIMSKNHFLYCVNNLSYPHLLGLENIGQTCYMNSTLECLSNIKVLTNYILNMACGQLNPKKHKLTTIYFDVLYKLFFPSNSTRMKKCIAPHNFKAIIGK